MKPVSLLLLALSISLSASGQQQPSSGQWQQSQKTDTLRGVSYPQFILTGKWLTPPKRGADTPSLVVHCQPGQHHGGRENGKFIDGYFVAGAVLDGHVGTSGGTVTIVQFRLDDKKIQTGYWTPSTDFGGAFFTEIDLNNL
jgi:hypothetical protein